MIHRTTLICTALHCTALHCSLYYTAAQFTTLYCALYHTIMHTSPHHTAPFSNTPHHTAPPTSQYTTHRSRSHWITLDAKSRLTECGRRSLGQVWERVHAWQMHANEDYCLCGDVQCAMCGVRGWARECVRGPAFMHIQHRCIWKRSLPP
jgi:hypothetical protein